MSTNNASSKSRLVVFLGTHAQSAHYKSADVPESGADLLLPWNVWQHSAQARDIEGLPEIVVVGTDETRQDWIESRRLTDDLRRAGYPRTRALPVAFLCYDEGKLLEPDGFWDFFESMHIILAGGPLALNQPNGLDIAQGNSAAFDQPANHLIVDITHGYRSIPFLSSAVLDFIQTSRLPVRHEILYAVLKGSVATVRDLSLYNTAGRLNRALQQLHRHGRATDLASFFEASEIAACRALSKPMRRFSDDLLFLRLPKILSDSGLALLEALEANWTALTAAFPPVVGPLQQLRDRLLRMFPDRRPIAASVSREAIVAAQVLAEMLGETENYLHLYALLRESWTSIEPLRHLDPRHIRQHSDPEFYKADERSMESDWALRPKTRFRRNHEWQANQQHEALFRLRNDVLHCSMRGAPKQHHELKNAIERELKTFLNFKF